MEPQIAKKRENLELIGDQLRELPTNNYQYKDQRCSSEIIDLGEIVWE